MVFLQTYGMNYRAHTEILVNDVAMLTTYNWDQDVGTVNVSPTVVLYLRAGKYKCYKNYTPLQKKRNTWFRSPQDPSLGSVTP